MGAAAGLDGGDAGGGQSGVAGEEFGVFAEWGFSGSVSRLLGCRRGRKGVRQRREISTG